MWGGTNRARLLATVTAALCAIVAALAASASASHNFEELLSIGPTGGNGNFDAQFRGSSADGLIALFETDESLVAADTDSQIDLYSRDDTGTTTRVSTGPTGGNGAFSVFFRAASTNGARVIFDTAEPLVATDTDSQIDIYQRLGGVTTLLSTGTGGNGPHDAGFRAASADGTRLYFETRESLAAGDTDAQVDVYLRQGSTTTLISAGAINGNGAFDASFVDASADGSRLLFDTREVLAAGDTDASVDLYERSAGTTTRISAGAINGNGAFDAFFAGASDDGTRVFIHSREPLATGDTDTRFDVYQRLSGATTRISAGAINGNGAFDAFLSFVSQDGLRAVFESVEPLVAADTDTQNDVYERMGSTTTFLSTGPSTGPGTFIATYEGATADGTRVYFETGEPLVVTDTDSQTDVYERVGTTTTLISTGPAGGNGPFPAGFDGVFNSGGRIFFRTDEPLVASDGDNFADVYEREGSATTLVSGGLSGGNGDFFADFFGASADGSRVFIHTDESLTAGDTDEAQDVYAATSAPLYARPGSATPLRVPLVPAYAQCTLPNSTHVGPKLSPGPGTGDPSCTPPALESGQLKIGSTGAGAASIKLRAIPGNTSTGADEADISVEASATDVQKKSDSTDYTGDVLLFMRLRITDRANASFETTPGTVSDATFSAPIDCTATGGANGSNCTMATTTDTLVPGFAKESKRSVISAVSLEVKDAGVDGNVLVAGCPPDCGTGDEGVFLREGMFTP